MGVSDGSVATDGGGESGPPRGLQAPGASPGRHGIRPSLFVAARRADVYVFGRVIQKLRNKNLRVCNVAVFFLLLIMNYGFFEFFQCAVLKQSRFSLFSPPFSQLAQNHGYFSIPFLFSSSNTLFSHFLFPQFLFGPASSSLQSFPRLCLPAWACYHTRESQSCHSVTECLELG